MTDAPQSRAEVMARRNRIVGGLVASVVLAMVGLAYASVPLYELFCRVTGYGGTTQVAEKPPEQKVLDRVVKIRFDSNVNPALKWAFKPLETKVDVKVGEERLAFYQATNLSDQPLVGTATFNVTPDKAGLYFNKVECFCFTEQLLQPGQTIDMPVSFFLDPELAEDQNMDGVTTITLSYTFHRAKDQSKAERHTASSMVDAAGEKVVN